MNSHLSPQIIEHKKDHDVVLEIQILSWIRDKNVAVLNCLMGSHPPHSDNWISNSNTDKRPVLIRLISKRQHTIIKMNDNINTYSTIAGSVNDNINTNSTIAGSVNAHR